ncbi:MAG: glycogen/starch synthase [Prevotellaceae bacterium]|jgi:starch synthase|nr:glycogen/starch synthase [Prevotellaceae bacterium]
MDTTTSSRVLFICSEIAPFVPDSEMSVMGRLLPQWVQDNGREIRSFMPRFGHVNERRNQLHEVIRLSGLNLIIDDTDHPLIIKVASMPGSRTQVYFIDNDDFFQRKNALVDDDGMPFEDNDERSIFFVRGVLETIKKLRWKPNIVHCQGWFTFLATLYMKRAYKDDPIFSRTKIILAFTENDIFEGTLGARLREKLVSDGIRAKDVETLETASYENLVKVALTFANGVIFFGKKNPKVSTWVRAAQKPVLHCKKPQQELEICNDFYTQIMRTR